MGIVEKLKENYEKAKQKSFEKYTSIKEASAQTYDSIKQEYNEKYKENYDKFKQQMKKNLDKANVQTKQYYDKVYKSSYNKAQELKEYVKEKALVTYLKNKHKRFLTQNRLNYRKNIFYICCGSLFVFSRGFNRVFSPIIFSIFIGPLIIPEIINSSIFK
jgi:ElaB/YqjD/DUF883 family membrane-anchored ribosome-binding protein